MLKEIYEQPRSIEHALSQYLTPEAQQETIRDLALTNDDLRGIRKINVVASGTSRHAGMAGEFMIERLAMMPVEVDHSSQYCYRDPLTGPDELTVLLSQSGTTVDTLAALREAKRKGAKTVSICNVPNTPLTDEADGVVLTHAGKEVSIAATKSFTAQLVALFALAVHLGGARRTLTTQQAAERFRQLREIPSLVEQAIQNDDAARALAQGFKEAQSFMYLGRDISYPIALEGALKLKETSYIHAEGFPTGEMKHGPSALVDKSLPVVMILTRGSDDPTSELRYSKSLANLEELVGRGTPVIVVANQRDDEIASKASHVLTIPEAPSLLLPILEIIPLQLLAYHLAVARGMDVDRPRNLSKSVMVE